MSLFSIISELQIGSIVEVSGTSIRVELNGEITELTRTYAGRVYPIGQFASVIKIHFGRQILLAYVRLLRMRSEVAIEEGKPLPSEDSRIIDADLFGEIIWNDLIEELRFYRGIKNYPLPGQSVYLTTHDELQLIYQGAEKKRKEKLSPLIPIGHYVGSESATCYADLNKMFGLHCAVLGSTGSGKSGTVAAILHSVLEHKIDDQELRPRIIIIDPHGEYANAFKKRAIVYRAYNILTNDEGTESKQLSLPYWILTGEEFREMIVGKTEYEATSENNIVYKALSHARLVQKEWIDSSKNWLDKTVDDCSNPDAHRPKEDKYKPLVSSYDRDTPDPFSLQEFENHILNEQGIKPSKGKWEKMSYSDLKSISSVIDKLSVLRSDPRLKFMMSEYKAGDPDLSDILKQFIGNLDGKGSNDIVDVRIIDISGIPNEVAGPLTASIARLLFQYKVWQNRAERERDPVLIVCEEAHRYVPDTGLAEYQSAQKAIRRIAKEGRKYGIGLMLVSQRPSDVERTVLSQCNSWFVMRLTNSSDQEHVNRFLPDSLSGLSRMLSSLSRQEAIFVGEAAAIPARIMIRTLDKEQLPRSDDIGFINGWVKPPISDEEIKKVIMRWRKEGS